MTAAGIALNGPLLGVAVGDALGRPVEGLSSAEVARQYGRVSELYADGVAGESAGTVTSCTRDTLAVARTLASGPVAETSGPSVGADWFADREPPVTGRQTLLPRVVACAGLSDEGGVSDGGGPPDGDRSADDRGSSEQTGVRESAVRWVVGDVDEENRAAALAFVDLLVAFGGGADPETALDRALDRASERGAPPSVRTALAVALDPVERREGTVGVLEVAAHEAATATDAEAAVVAAASRGGPATRLGAAAGALAGARFGATFPKGWLDRIPADEVREVAATFAE